VDALNDPNVWVQNEGTERKEFEAIPFTKSLHASLGERILDERFLHLIVTGGEPPFTLKPATPALTVLTIPVSKVLLSQPKCGFLHGPRIPNSLRSEDTIFGPLVSVNAMKT
jgi:hypothetical protein